MTFIWSCFNTHEMLSYVFLVDACNINAVYLSIMESMGLCKKLREELCLPQAYGTSSQLYILCYVEIYYYFSFHCRADLFSESQRIQYTIQTRTQGIPDARTYLLTLKEIRIKYVSFCYNYLFFLLYM